MARYKTMNSDPKLLPVDLVRRLIPGTIEAEQEALLPVVGALRATAVREPTTLVAALGLS